MWLLELLLASDEEDCELTAEACQVSDYGLAGIRF